MRVYLVRKSVDVGEQLDGDIIIGGARSGSLLELLRRLTLSWKTILSVVC